jgi:hypothetical protein
MSKDINGFSDNDEIENEKAYLCGLSVNKDYINTMDIAINCNFKVTMIFMRDML